MAHPVTVTPAQILQEVQREAVRQGYETPVCTYFETLYSPGELVAGQHGPIAGWLLLVEATGAAGGPTARMRATVEVLPSSRHIEIRARR